ncbi:hypothetical protein TNIN_405511 [Trichonephila inaurata madagascariensis]|uniref:Uncharacterized protein n=1 Tax=Trichonephila inaurata madagascariensis TaxID=2747483 RepID=A0A8X6I894_9ARAC|nr:hypothetical protein TNIN_405511 [Trichonephila inaurata madagascariensis]
MVPITEIHFSLARSISQTSNMNRKVRSDNSKWREGSLPCIVIKGFSPKVSVRVELPTPSRLMVPEFFHARNPEEGLGVDQVCQAYEDCLSMSKVKGFCSCPDFTNTFQAYVPKIFHDGTRRAFKGGQLCVKFMNWIC